jgi:hypothetical protein
MTHGSDIAFDDSGRPVQTVEPEVYNEPDPEPAGLELVPLLEWFLIGARDAGEVGQRLVLLGYLIRAPGAPRSLRELAVWFGCSHTAARRRVSRFKADFARELQDLRSKPHIGEDNERSTYEFEYSDRSSGQESACPAECEEVPRPRGRV